MSTGITRILVVVKSDGIGGVERFLSAMVPALARRGVHTDVIALGRPLSGAGLLADLGVPVLDDGFLPGPVGRLRQLVTLRRVVDHGGYGAVVGIGPAANGLVCLARRRNGPLTIVREVGDPFIDRRRRWNRWFGWTYRRADALVVQTEALAQEVRQHWRNPARVAVIPNPLGAEIAVTTPGEGRGNVIAGVGRLVAGKGYNDLLHAFANAGPATDGWSILIIGDGPERRRLEALAAELRLSARVRFTGTHPAPWELLASASIFVLCSRHEGFPNVLLEAMASGCAVIASDCRFGPREIIDDGLSGLLYPVGDVARLATLLGELTTHPERRRELARGAAERAAHFAIDGVVESWLGLLNAVPPVPDHG